MSPATTWHVKLVDGTRYEAEELAVTGGILRFTGRITDPVTGPRGPLGEYVFPARVLGFARRQVRS